MNENSSFGDRIAHILWELKAGKSSADVCRAHGISDHALGAWRTEYAGLAPSDIDRKRDLQDREAAQRRRRSYAHP